MKSVLLTLLLASATWTFAAHGDVTPLLNTHSHNDYEQKRPLAEALDQGFCSVEADIHLVDGQLLVAHDHSQVRPDKTLESMYLDPLRNRIRQQGGIYPGKPYFILLIDVKTAAAPTYLALEKVLENYKEILSRFTAAGCETNFITVLISGNRDIRLMAGETVRWAAMDGELVHMRDNPPLTLVPQISEEWSRHFHWRGGGPMPDSERAKLRDIVSKVHEQHRTLRFWDTPDLPVIWQELLDAKVDIIQADHLKRLRDYLTQPPK